MNPAAMDEALLALIKERHEPSLEMLYNRRGQAVYSFVLRILRSVPDAEEVTQEVFLKLWNSADRFDSARGGVLAWMITMARHLAIDRTRSKTYRARKTETDIDRTPVEATLASKSPDAEVTLIKAEQQGAISEALANVGTPYRQVIELAYFEGLSHSAIALQLDAPLGTVKTRLRQGVSKLRTMLDGRI